MSKTWSVMEKGSGIGAAIVARKADVLAKAKADVAKAAGKPVEHIEVSEPVEA